MRIVIMILLVVASLLAATLFSCMLAALKDEKRNEDAYKEKQDK